MSNYFFKKSFNLESIFIEIEKKSRDPYNNGFEFNKAITIKAIKENYETIQQLDVALMLKLQDNGANNSQSNTCINYLGGLLVSNQDQSQYDHIKWLFNQILIEMEVSMVKSNFNNLVVVLEFFGSILREIESKLIINLFNQLPHLENDILNQLSSVYLYLLNNEHPFIRFINITQRMIFVDTITSFTKLYNNQDFKSFYPYFIKIKSSKSSNYINSEYNNKNVYEEIYINNNIHFYL